MPYQINIIDLFSVNFNSEKYIIEVSINGKYQKIKVDSGSKF